MKVLKEAIPLELLEKCLKAAGLQGAHDRGCFSKSQLKLEQLEALFPDLEKFYQPYRARQRLNAPLNGTQAIGMLKLLLASQKLHLAHKLKVNGAIKTMWYYIENPPKIVEDIEVSFK